MSDRLRFLGVRSGWHKILDKDLMVVLFPLKDSIHEKLYSNAKF